MVGKLHVAAIIYFLIGSLRKKKRNNLISKILLFLKLGEEFSHIVITLVFLQHIYRSGYEIYLTNT